MKRLKGLKPRVACLIAKRTVLRRKRTLHQLLKQHLRRRISRIQPVNALPPIRHRLRGLPRKKRQTRHLVKHRRIVRMRSHQLALRFAGFVVHFQPFQRRDAHALSLVVRVHFPRPAHQLAPFLAHAGLIQRLRADAHVRQRRRRPQKPSGHNCFPPRVLRLAIQVQNHRIQRVRADPQRIQPHGVAERLLGRARIPQCFQLANALFNQLLYAPFAAILGHLLLNFAVQIDAVEHPLGLLHGLMPAAVIHIRAQHILRFLLPPAGVQNLAGQEQAFLQLPRFAQKPHQLTTRRLIQLHRNQNARHIQPTARVRRVAFNGLSNQIQRVRIIPGAPVHQRALMNKPAFLLKRNHLRIVFAHPRAPSSSNSIRVRQSLALAFSRSSRSSVSLKCRRVLQKWQSTSQPCCSSIISVSSFSPSEISARSTRSRVQSQ